MSMIREAIENLFEANIWKDAYGPGSKVVLKNEKKLPPYKNGDVFEKTVPQEADLVVNIGGKTTDTIFMKDKSGKVIEINGSRGNINGLFNHSSNKGKSNTDFLTALKENISLRLFLNGEISEEEVISGLSDKEKEFYQTIYYESAVAQLRSINKFGLKTTIGYYGERQAGKETKKLYELSKKLSKLQADNWNPADVWLIKETFLSDFRYFIKSFNTDFQNIQNLNLWLQEQLNNRNVLPISLKQVEDGEAHTEIVGMHIEVDMDFEIDYIDLNTESFNNVIPWTKSGFAPRIGFKSSQESLNVYVEGREKGSKYQLGAVDKKALVSKLESLGADVSVKKHSDDSSVKKYLKEAFSKYKFKKGGKGLTFSEAYADYKKLDDFAKLRAYNLVLFLHAITVLSRKHGQNEFFEWMYKYSRKITDKSSDYIIVH